MVGNVEAILHDPTVRVLRQSHESFVAGFELYSARPDRGAAWWRPGVKPSLPMNCPARIDATTPTGRAIWQMIGVLAELERSLIVERTQAGMT